MIGNERNEQAREDENDGAPKGSKVRGNDGGVVSRHVCNNFRGPGNPCGSDEHPMPDSNGNDLDHMPNLNGNNLNDVPDACGHNENTVEEVQHSSSLRRSVRGYCLDDRCHIAEARESALEQDRHRRGRAVSVLCDDEFCVIFGVAVFGVAFTVQKDDDVGVLLQ